MSCTTSIRQQHRPPRSRTAVMISPHKSTIVAVALVAGLAVATACGPRQVEVRTAPPVADTLGTPSVQLTNNLSQAVNVYVNVSGGTELFLRQVPANTVEKVPVNGVAKGARCRSRPSRSTARAPIRVAMRRSARVSSGASPDRGGAPRPSAQSTATGCWCPRRRIAFGAGGQPPAHSYFRPTSPPRDPPAAGPPCALGVA